MLIEQFKQEIEKVTEVYEIDEHCIKHLRDISHDYGKEGLRARALLSLICDMLEI